MRQSSRAESFQIAWDKLTQQATRLRAGLSRPRENDAAVTRTAQGKPVTDWSKAQAQSIQCQIQPHVGNIAWKPEGLTQDTTHILYCNMVCQSTGAGNVVPVDLVVGDRVVGPDGVKYRVVFVDNAAGMNHHYEVLLSTIFPEGV